MNDEQLITQYIELNPHRPGLSEARLKDYGVAVWALIGYLQAAHGDHARVAADYDVPQEAVEAAIAYYERHRPLIDTRLDTNTVDDPNLLQPT